MLKIRSILRDRGRYDLGRRNVNQLAANRTRLEENLPGKEIGADLAGSIAPPLGCGVEVDLVRAVLARFRLRVVRMGAGEVD
jgi:hypothetical protein